MTIDIQTLATFQPFDTDRSSYVYELMPRKDYASWYRWFGGNDIPDEIVEMICEDAFNRIGFQGKSLETLIELANLLSTLGISSLNERRHLFNAYCQAHFGTRYGAVSFSAVTLLARVNPFSLGRR